MNEPTLAILAGALLITASAWAIFAAAVRAGPRVAPIDRPSPAERWLRAGVLAIAAMVTSTAVLGLAGGLSTFGVAAAALVLWLLSRRLAPARGSPATIPRARSRLAGCAWPAALSCLLAAVDVAVRLPATASGWDAMTYHLYFPARWLQEGRLLHVPTVFSDNAAAFAPQNGALFFAWQMALAGRDALVDVSQVLALAVAALALFAIGRRLGVSREPAMLGAATVVWLAPVRFWTFSANVDVLMVACWLAVLAWQLRAWQARTSGPPEAGVAALAGLAAGLAAGTKTLGLPLVAFTALPWALALAWRRRWPSLGAWLAGTILGGGWWYVRNAWLYGNPLFPLEIDLGLFRLPGAYGGAALRAGEFHLGAAAAMAAVLREFGPGTCVLMAVGVAGLAGGAAVDLRRPARRGRAAAAAFLAALAAGWAAFFVFAVPHNSQTRFLMPTLVLSLAGWARVLQWATRRGGRSLSRGLWLLAIVATSAALPPWRLWRATLETLAAGGVDAGAWLWSAGASAAAAAAAFLAARAVPGRRAALFRAAGVLVVAAMVAVAGLHAERGRAAFLARADFASWRDGYLPFQPRAPLARVPGLRIAYTGANIPYALTGSGWRHRVTYVNTQGEPGDAFYDFWRRDPRTYSYHKPGLYRGRDDPARWLEHLEAARIDVLVIFRLHPAERGYLESDAEGFPIERRWARRHREGFELLVAGPAAEIYRFLGSRTVTLPDRSSGSSP